MDYAIFSPHPYQDLIINHQIDIMRCNIWAGMGMGKTVATLTALEDLLWQGQNTPRTGPRAATCCSKHRRMKQ